MLHLAFLACPALVSPCLAAAAESRIALGATALEAATDEALFAPFGRRVAAEVERLLGEPGAIDDPATLRLLLAMRVHLAHHFRDDARAVVHEFRHELRAAGCLLVAHHAIGVDHRLAPRIGIRVAEVRHVALAGNEIGQAITIEIATGRGVRLREGDIAGVLRQEVVHDHVLGKRDVLVRITLLFPPREAEPVPFHRPIGVEQSIAVDVERADFRAARAALGRAPASEGRRMVLPRAFRRAFRRLLPPAVRVQVVGPAIAVDVANAEAMADVHAPRARLGNRVRRPHRRRIGRIPL